MVVVVGLAEVMVVVIGSVSQEHASASHLRSRSVKTSVYVLPHRDKKFRSDFLSHLVTVYWYRDDLSKR